MNLNKFLAEFKDLWLSLALLCACVLGLVACGGGTTGGSTNSSGLTLTLTDTSGKAVTTMEVGSYYTLIATLTPTTDVTVSNVIVTFTPGSGGSLKYASGTALSNGSGVATMGFLATTPGAFTATAKANVPKTTTSTSNTGSGTTTTTSTVAVSGGFNYAVSAAASSGSATTSVQLSNFSASPSSISSAANSALSVAVRVNNSIPTSATSVSFVALCGQISPAVAVVDGNGNATTTYKANKADGTLCQGVDTITATSSGVSATTTITVAAPTTGSIVFVSAAPAQIFLNGSGATSTSTLSFKSTYQNGIAAAGVDVKLILVANPGGVTFGTTGNTSPVTVTSDSSGVATVAVYAGNTPGPVTLQAQWVSNANISVSSNALTVASGPAQQKTLTLTASKNNLDAWVWDGDTATITARVADANGNPVADGTVVNFVSSGGQINRSCSTTTANTGGTNASGFSQCSVILMGQNPRPTNGRVVVLAYLEGVKNYTDTNGNNKYDAGTDGLNDMGDAYRDDNENGVFDTGEFVVARGGTGVCAAGNGSSLGGVGTGGISTTGFWGAAPARANTCDSQLAGTVRLQIPVFFSSKDIGGVALTTSSFSTPEAQTFSFYLYSKGPSVPIPIPYGTTLTASVLSPTGCAASDLATSTFLSASYTGVSPTENVASKYPNSVILTGTAASGSTPAVVCRGGKLKISYTTQVSGVTSSVLIDIP